MRFATMLLPLVLLTTACGESSVPTSGTSSDRQVASQEPSAPPAATTAASPGYTAKSEAADAAKPAQGRAGTQTVADTSTVPLADADGSRSAGEAFNRKIIRNAEMAIEVEEPAPAQQRISSIAESNGGFIVTSEIRQSGSSYTNVTITMRVPADRFGAAVEAIRTGGGTVTREKITGQDVTEEYIDLEARIRTKVALEQQFLEIMKQAKSVSDALEVQTQIANVRTEIERLEGRKRFLENQSSLSTITVTISSPTPVVRTESSGFMAAIKRAFGDAIDVGSNIIIGFIRLVGVTTPILILIVLPMLLILRFAWKLARRRWEARTAPDAPPSIVNPPE